MLEGTPYAVNLILVKRPKIHKKLHFFLGPLQVKFLLAFINCPVVLDCEFPNRFCYSERLNPCTCADCHTYETNIKIMWTNHAKDGSGRVNQVKPIYYKRGNFILSFMAFFCKYDFTLETGDWSE